MLIVVTGPPAAGKSAWVRANARPGDIIIDYDLIATALSAQGAEAHDHPKPIRHTAYRARHAAITEAIRHAATVDVYVIHSLPSEETRARYAEHNARIIAIDPGRDVVLARVESERPRSARVAVERWYAERRDDASQQVGASRNW